MAGFLIHAYLACCFRLVFGSYGHKSIIRKVLPRHDVDDLPVVVDQSLESEWAADLQRGWDFFTDKLTERPTCTDFRQEFGSNASRTLLDESHHKAIIEHTLEKCEGGSPMELDLFVKKKTGGEKKVHFLHTSKTGGTFFCACAWANGQNRAHGQKNDPDKWDGTQNCHFLGEDWPAWLGWEFTGKLTDFDKLVSSTPSTMLSKYIEEKIDVEGNENFLPDFGLSDELTNVVFVRPTLERILSHSFEIVKRSSVVLNRTIDEYVQHFGMLADNYFTRTLAGREAFYKPVGTLNETDLQRALHNLHQFDEYLLADRTLGSEIQSAFGWDCSSVPGSRESSFPGGTPALLSAAEATWGKEGLQKLEALNNFDQTLYLHGKMLAAAKR